MRLLHELRRRQMFRLTGLYIVGAWLVIQVADIAFPTWGIPDSAMRFLFYAAFLCYPIAFIFGWIFDIRKDGIYRTRKAGPDDIVETKMQWQDYAVLAALAGVGVFILLGSADRIRTETESVPDLFSLGVERRENSVAVLPFENLDPNPETGYFSDGVADEILSKLANFRTLFVIGRESSYAFRHSDEGPTSIAAKLGVQYLLSGTVRRDGDLVRVTARLIGEDGAHVWSQSFDRKLEKTLAIQAEIAHEVANRIASEVTRPRGVEVTESIVPEAYTNYLLGKKLFLERPYLWHENALPLFRKAIELDPEFGPAHAYLAISLSIFGLPPERLEEVEAANEKATELVPDLAETLFAKALLVRRRDQDTQAAIALLRQAIERDPALSAAYTILGNTLYREGQFSEAQRLREDALSRDPLNPVLIVNVAWQYLRRGDFDRGVQLMLRMAQLPERPQFFHHHVKTMYWKLGRYDEYIRWSKDEIRTEVQREWEPERRDSAREYLFNVLSSHAYAYTQVGLHETGLRLLILVAEGRSDDTGRRIGQADLCIAQGDFNCAANLYEALRNEISENDAPWLGTAIGISFALAEDYEKAVEYLEPIFKEGELEKQLKEPEDFELARYLVFAYRAQGRNEEANLLAHEYGSILDALVEEMNPGIEPVLTEIALSSWLRGDHDGAVEAFRRAVNAGWLYLYEAQQDPLWREFFRIADFDKEIRAVETEIERQRAVVEAADAEDDFDEVLKAFFAKSEPDN